MKTFFKAQALTAEEKRSRRRERTFAKQRARRTWSRKAPAKAVKASDAPGLGLPKGRTRAEEKVESDAAETAQIYKVRAMVWKRSRGRCESCGWTEAETAKVCAKRAHEMHETFSRAMTRGMSPGRRFDARWCVRVCQSCHAELTASFRFVLFADLHLGADSAIEIGTSPFREGWFTPKDVWMAAI